jgi:glyoxylase-like metal-dependent hydrolase (beta-lactamase superfamily II)
MKSYPAPSRRTFLKITSACAAHVALMATPFPAAARVLWSRRIRGEVVAREPFGRLESVGEGLWAFISTPLGGDYTTVSNGGILAGRDGVLVVEAFQTPEGARWIAEKARELTGRWPTHVLVTHYHSDHSNGVQGFSPEDAPANQPAARTGSPGPAIHVTPATQGLKQTGLTEDVPESLRRLWADVVLMDGEAPGALDLGSRTVELIPRRGHTPSDVTVELPEEGITWCGDLVWNGMFPNYMDAVPSQLSKAVRAIQSDARELYVPGHGPLAESRDIATYVAVIDGLEETARMARREGWTSEEAGARHRIPEELGEWTLFNPTYFQRAVEAWMREWDARS